jgi:ATP-binding cassette subfamily F protein uup
MNNRSYIQYIITACMMSTFLMIAFLLSSCSVILCSVMNILSVNNLSKIGRETPLFTGVTFGLDSGDKAAIIGKNGTGKSTLLNVIAGVIVPDEGTVVMNREAGVSYLSQNPAFVSGDTIRNHIFKSKSVKLETIREYEDLCLLMADGLTAIQQKRFDELTLAMDKGDLWNYEAQIRSILSMLGISDMTRKMGTLSGGMVKKVALAQVLVEDTQLLLLDEPTNHLDISTIVWLQNYLHDTKRCVLMVTHDRWFLDAVCNNIYELAHAKLKLYQGNYSTYLEKKTTESEIESNTERRIESVLRIERDWLLRGPCARGTKAKARIQRDEQMINREKFTADKEFTFEVSGRRLGGKILELHNISKNFPKGYANESEKNMTSVLSGFSYTFSKGQRIGIFGDNGTGKSTLLNIITGTIEPDTGTVVRGVNTVFGYYQQNPVFKDLSLTVLDYIKEAAEIMRMNDGTTLSAAQFLEQFGFEGKIQFSPLSSLSGGERKRVFLVRLLITNPNFLILDEPTNDFDIFTMNILEQFLAGYDGCLLIVSHDRYFMDKVADTLFILENDGSVSGFVGKCSEYIEYREEKRKADEEAADAAQKAAEEKEARRTAAQAAQTAAQTKNGSGTGATKPRRRTYKEKMEFESLEKEIAGLETKQKTLETAMSTTDYAKSQAAGDEYAKASAQLEKNYARWEELAALGE